MRRIDWYQACVTLIALLLTSPPAHVCAQHVKGASVSLLAKWPGTSFLLETVEFLVGCRRTQTAMYASAIFYPPIANDSWELGELPFCRQTEINQLSGVSWTAMMSLPTQVTVPAGRQ